MKNKRKIYFIKKKFQLEIILKIIVVWLIGVFASGILLYLFAGDSLTTRYENSRLLIGKTGNMIISELVRANIVNLIFVVLVGVFIALYISHRLAGPLYRFERTLEAMKKGDVSFRIKLRKKDELVDLVPLFNQTLDSWDMKLNHIKENTEKLKTSLRGIETELTDKKKIEEINKMIQKLNEAIAEFKISADNEK